jgi:hypothetical protein
VQTDAGLWVEPQDPFGVRVRHSFFVTLNSAKSTSLRRQSAITSDSTWTWVSGFVGWKFIESDIFDGRRRVRFLIGPAY